MNNLNSILIEGYLVYDPTLSLNGTVSFVLKVNISGMSPDNNQFSVRVNPGKLAQACLSHLDAGNGLRIVGHLESYLFSDGKTYEAYIIAEHVEFKPILKKLDKAKDNRPANNDAEWMGDHDSGL